MKFPDLLRMARDSALRARMRSAMLLLAMSIGVAAVVALTSLGEGARLYVTGEFQTLARAWSSSYQVGRKPAASRPAC